MNVENFDKKIIGYQLNPIYETTKDSVATRAFILCNFCGNAISTNNGPKYNSVCFDCLDKITQK